VIASVASNSATATSALSGVKIIRARFENGRQGIRYVLGKADAKLFANINTIYTFAAQTEWNLPVRFAQQLSEMAVPVEPRTRPLAT
jgi:hypothetical protein